MFGAKLQGRQNLDLRTAELWTVGLKKLNVTLSEFLVASELAICQAWPPTCVEDFVALARKEKSQPYPDSYAAFVFACQNEGKTADIKAAYSHIVIYEAVKRIGSHVLKHADDKIFGQWDKVYQQVCQEHASGSEFTLPVASRIEHVPPTPATAEQVNEYLDKIKKMLGGVK